MNKTKALYMKKMIRHFSLYAVALALSFSTNSCKPEELGGEVVDDNKIYLTASAANKDVDYFGEEFKFNISSNTRWEIKITANWIKTSVESGEGDAEITVKCTATEEKKTGSVQFSLQQRALNPQY